MINLFQFAPQDKALEYMAKIFGYMNGIIPVTGVGASVTESGTAVAGGTYSGAAGTSITLLGTMFKTFNSIILAVAVLVVVYITIMGVLVTAHEGEFLGKKWHSLWTPIRTVLGIAFLVPTSSGYCILQLIMMWVIVQGVGAADTMWNTVLAYVDVAGSPYAQVTVPSVGYKSALNGWFQGMVCQATTKVGSSTEELEGVTGQTKYYCNENSSSAFCRMNSATMFNFTLNTGVMTSYPFGPSGSCGVLTWCSNSTREGGSCSEENGGSTGLACKACTAELTAIQNVYPILANIAAFYAMADANYNNYITQAYDAQTYEYKNEDGETETHTGTGNFPNIPPEIQSYCTDNGITDCYRDKTTGEGLPDPKITSGSASSNAVKDLYWKYYILPKLPADQVDFMTTVTNEFSSGLDALFEQFTKDMTDRLQSSGSFENSDLADAGNEGWIMAGSYYYTIAKMNENNLKDVMPVFTYDFSRTDSRSPNSPGNPLYDGDYRNNYAGAGYIISSSQSGADLEGSSSLPSDVDELGAVSSSVTSAIQDTTSGSLSGDSNPLVQAQQAGYAILMIAQIGFFIFLGLTFMVALIGNLSVYVLGTGVTNPVGPAIQLMFLILVPAVVALFGIMVSLGATLSVYLPLVPFIIFTFGAIGWLTSTIETMVAGPLVALGVIAPGGHHEMFGKAEPALMLLFNVFLRPSLMIFGLVAAMLLASVVVGMINGAFWRVMTSISAGSSSSSTAGEAANVMSPLTLILFLCAYVMMVISALNKCFAAIHIIPERVMRWIGGQGEQYGESDAMGEVKGGVASGAKGAGSAAGTAGKAPEGASQAERKQQEFGIQKGREDAKKKEEAAKGTSVSGDDTGQDG